MKASHSLLTAALLAASAIAAHAQGGSLTPPAGPPSATMKSLDIVEPRIPLVAGSPGVTVNGTSGTITISQPGSYYLTKNLQVIGNASGIVINSSNVTVDLMGFAILSPPSGDADTGIQVDGTFLNITVRNGHIRSTTTETSGVYSLAGFYYGLFAAESTSNVRVENISVSGVRGMGVCVASASCGSISNCSADIAGEYGFYNPSGIVHDSTTAFSGLTGIFSSVCSGCTVRNTNAEGIVATVVINCKSTGASSGISSYIVQDSLGEGTYTGISSVIVSGSSGTASSSLASVDGISAYVVAASYGSTPGGKGIAAQSVSQCIGNADGISVTSHGISAGTVCYSHGSSSGGSGISATRAVAGCYGLSAGLHGIDCLDGTVTNSCGRTTKNSSTVRGIRGAIVSQSCGEATGTSGGDGIEGIRSVTGSYGYSEGWKGIFSNAGAVSDSYGYATGSSSDDEGINAQIVTNSRGQATGGVGIQANTLVLNSSGTSSASHGINVLRAAQNCYGATYATVNTAHGIYSQDGNVSNCWGWSLGNGAGSGIKARIVISSNGVAVAGALHGIDARIVESSYGSRDTAVAGRYGILANRASLCEAVNGESITNRYNMPP